MEERPEERGTAQPAAEGRGEAPEAAEDTSAAWEGGSGWINTEVAAAALDVSPRTVRDYIAAGKLVARTEGSGVQRRHMVGIGSLQALLDHRRRGSPTSPPRGRREERASAEASMTAAGSADASSSSSAARTIRELVARLEARSAEAADARARLELAERAHSALRGELEGEREERRRMGEEAGRLREELEAERSRGCGGGCWGDDVRAGGVTRGPSERRPLDGPTQGPEGPRPTGHMRAQSGAPDGGVVSSEGKVRTGSRIKGRRKAPRFKAIGTFVKGRFSRLRGFSEPDVTPALLPQ